MKTLTCLSALAIAWVLGGCSPQAQERYERAGQETREAVRTDLETMREETRRRGEPAKRDLERSTAEATLRARIQAALVAAQDVRSREIIVEVSGRTIVLSGSVESDSQRERAERIAADVVGPGYEVVSQLGVTGGATGPDRR
jgi:osmotically-inducible protein OsmY